MEKIKMCEEKNVQKDENVRKEKNVKTIAHVFYFARTRFAELTCIQHVFVSNYCQISSQI